MVFGLGVVIAVSVLAAAGVLSMVFPWRAHRLQGVWGGGFERPCLANLRLEGRGGRRAAAVQGGVREARGMGAGRWASISRGEYHQ